MMGYYAMLRRGYDQLGTDVSLKDVYAILTLKCNLRCGHCYIEAGPERTESMPMELRKKVIDEASRYKTDRITFSGGEVTTEMNKLVDTLKYVDEVKRRTGYPKRVLLQTNALFLVGYGDKEIKKKLEILKRSGATSMEITSYDDFHNIDCDELKRIVRISRKVFSENYTLRGSGDTVVPIGRAKTHVPRKKWRSYRDCDIDDLKDVAISVDGSVHLCCWQAAPLGNLSDESFDEIFERYELSDNVLKKIGRKKGFDKLDNADISDLGIDKDDYDKLLEEFGGHGCGACKQYFKKHSVY